VASQDGGLLNARISRKDKFLQNEQVDYIQMVGHRELTSKMNHMAIKVPLNKS